MHALIFKQIYIKEKKKKIFQVIHNRKDEYPFSFLVTGTLTPAPPFSLFLNYAWRLFHLEYKFLQKLIVSSCIL